MEKRHTYKSIARMPNFAVFNRAPKMKLYKW